MLIDSCDTILSTVLNDSLSPTFYMIRPLETEQKSIWKVKCLDLRWSVMCWLLYLMEFFIFFSLQLKPLLGFLLPVCYRPSKYPVIQGFRFRRVEFWIPALLHEINASILIFRKRKLWVWSERRPRWRRKRLKNIRSSRTVWPTDRYHSYKLIKVQWGREYRTCWEFKR